MRLMFEQGAFGCLTKALFTVDILLITGPWLSQAIEKFLVR